MKNKYKDGEIVYARKNPDIKLVIDACIDRIYYCYVKSDRSQSKQFYYERELMTDTTVLL